MQHRLRPTTAALLILGLLSMCAVAFAAAPKKGGRYVGSSGAGYPLHFRVSKDAKSVDRLVVRFNPTCEAATGNTPAKFSFGPRRIRGGRFSGQSVVHRGPTETLTLRISGRFAAGGTAGGQVTATQQVKSLGKCKETSPFTAAVK
jgi:hypothetical protein